MNNSMFLKGHEIQVTFTHNVLEMGLLWSLDSIRIHDFVLQVIASFFFFVIVLIPTFFLRTFPKPKPILELLNTILEALPM